MTLMAALHITKDNFEAEVLNSDKPVLVDFWAAWCGPCQMLLPIVEELSNEVSNAKICKVNADEEPELARNMQVEVLPTFVILKDGEVVDRKIGFLPKGDLQGAIESKF